MRFQLIMFVWFVIALAAGAAGLPARLHPPMPQVVLLALTFALVFAGARWATFRAWVMSLRWESIVAIHWTRFVGLYFVWLYRQGELPYRFAVPGGVGDICVAVLAVALVLSSPAIERKPWLLFAWNVLGFVDIVLVVANAAILALSDPASMSALLRLPLCLLPTFLVPILIASHVLLFAKIRRARGSAG
jgi:hypothetical protein